jgi:hypothetical protein
MKNPPSNPVTTGAGRSAGDGLALCAALGPAAARNTISIHTTDRTDTCTLLVSFIVEV